MEFLQTLGQHPKRWQWLNKHHIEFCNSRWNSDIVSSWLFSVLERILAVPIAEGIKLSGIEVHQWQAMLATSLHNQAQHLQQSEVVVATLTEFFVPFFDKQASVNNQ